VPKFIKRDGSVVFESKKIFDGVTLAISGSGTPVVLDTAQFKKLLVEGTGTKNMTILVEGSPDGVEWFEIGTTTSGTSARQSFDLLDYKVRITPTNSDGVSTNTVNIWAVLSE
jgi:hypothetical protein